jgi:hypothetical protein
MPSGATCTCYRAADSIERRAALDGFSDPQMLDPAAAEFDQMAARFWSPSCHPTLADSECVEIDCRMHDIRRGRRRSLRRLAVTS